MIKRSQYYKISLSMIIALFTLFTPITMASTELELTNTVLLEHKRTNIRTTYIMDKRLLASQTFDLRTQIQIPVKDQKSTQNCWAFSSNTVLETNLALVKNEVYDFSERHMTYATAKTFTDGTNPLAHGREVTSGGNYDVAMAYFISGRGPVLEADMPFSETEQPIALSEIQGKTVQKRVTDYIKFPEILKVKDSDGNITYTNDAKTLTYTSAEVETNRNNIKQHIINYGAVTAMTVSGSAYNEYYNYNLDYPAFYCDKSDLKQNHQVTIIGWDDTYPIANFNESHRPSQPGAYLVLNSYGVEGNFKNGCYYISYEDAYVEQGISGIINAEDVNYDRIYQHDILGMSNSIGQRELETLYGANVFSRDKNVSEQINEIGIASLVSENIEVYINNQDGELTTDKLQKVEIEQTTIRQGYTTIKLKNPVKLVGDKFAVVVKCISNGQGVGIGVEIPTDGYWSTATANAGESFYSMDMTTWNDVATKWENTNICIKAFTTESSTISDAYVIDKDVIYKILPETKVEDFKNNLQSVQIDKILKNDIELKESDIITTNSQLITNDNKTYTLVVTGDITGNGSITITDVSKVKMHLIEIELLNAIQQRAADINYTNTITLTDLSQIIAALVGLISL